MPRPRKKKVNISQSSGDPPHKTLFFANSLSVFQAFWQGCSTEHKDSILLVNHPKDVKDYLQSISATAKIKTMDDTEIDDAVEHGDMVMVAPTPYKLNALCNHVRDEDPIHAVQIILAIAQKETATPSMLMAAIAIQYLKLANLVTKIQVLGQMELLSERDPYDANILLLTLRRSNQTLMVYPHHPMMVLGLTHSHEDQDMRAWNRFVQSLSADLLPFGKERHGDDLKDIIFVYDNGATDQPSFCLQLNKYTHGRRPYKC